MADIITVRGFVAGDVRPGTTNGGVNTANFRLGSTDRHYDRATQQWVDGDTNWFTVQAYRQLAGNIAGSVKKGQRVVVMGRLKLRQWERDGRVYNVAQIDAESIGHDLSWGTANYQRSVAQQPANRERDTVGEAAREEVLLVEGRRVDPDTGEFLDDRPTDTPRGEDGEGRKDGPLGVVRDVEETDRYPEAA
ncbi:single-stranded DNA-binding protein [Arthrobacter woluwensis]|uniref:single-stranded DNA-binding protein n=1 Tax=Arthrobacter woluwensis TaxID=156980 RepID=UPI000D11649C|nr:single-stranded DNA-binding protein [Arthrobacter woluwensis]PSS44870.1 single-stranded DNA-binding protein [Arthrobacter woluwensis]